MFKIYLFILLFLVILIRIYRINYKEGLLNDHEPIDVELKLQELRNVNNSKYNDITSNYTNREITEDLRYFNNTSYLIKNLKEILPTS